MRFAAALVRAGVEIADIETLGTLVQPTLAERGLRQLLQESDNKVTQSISATANLLQMIARHHRPVSAQDLKAIERLKTKLTLPRQVGMTDKNRDRLRPLQDPATLRRLVTLPEAIFSKTDKIYESYTTALACEDALAIGILLYAPIRCGNLAAIDIERNLQRPGDGPGLPRVRGAGGEERQTDRVRTAAIPGRNARPALGLARAAPLPSWHPLVVSPARRRHVDESIAAGPPPRQAHPP